MSTDGIWSFHCTYIAFVINLPVEYMVRLVCATNWREVIKIEVPSVRLLFVRDCAATDLCFVALGETVERNDAGGGAHPNVDESADCAHGTAMRS